MVDLTALIEADPHLAKALADAENKKDREDLFLLMQSSVAQEAFLHMLEEIPEIDRPSLSDAAATGNSEELIAALSKIVPDYEDRFLKYSQKEVTRLGLDVSV